MAKSELILKKKRRFERWTFCILLYLCNAELLCSGQFDPRFSDTIRAASEVWTEWSCWSSCSRTCREGVQTRSRVCRRQPSNDVTYYRKTQHDLTSKFICRGKTTEYRVCNFKRCFADGDAFRSHQCALHDGRTVRGKKVRFWSTNNNATNKCELSCHDPSHGFNYSFGKVENGTPCNEHSSDVCINGRCVSFGCDLRVGSTAIPDMCGICDGRNATCQQINKLIRHPVEQILDKTITYNVIAKIPFSSRHIFVRDTSGIIHFSLTNVNRTHIVDADSLIEDRVVDGANWRRRNDTGKQILSTFGPLQYDVYILISDQVLMKPILIEYWIERSVTQAISTSPTLTRLPPTTTLTTPQHFPMTARPWRHNLTSLPTPTPSVGTKSAIAAGDKNKGTTDDISSNSAQDQIGRKNGSKKKNSKQKNERRKHQTAKTGRGDECPQCYRGRNIQKQFCQSEFALRVFVIRSELLGHQRRYDVRVIQSYRNSVQIQSREFLWTQPDNCRCPRLIGQREYIVVGTTSAGRGREVRLTMARDGYARRFNLRRARKFQQLRREQKRLCARLANDDLAGKQHPRNHQHRT